MIFQSQDRAPPANTPMLSLQTVPLVSPDALAPSGGDPALLKDAVAGWGSI